MIIVHHQENLKLHSLRVTTKLTKLLTFDFLQDLGARGLGQNYMSAYVGNYLRSELLIFTGLFHDLGKGVDGILQFDAEGISSATNHEYHGARILSYMLPEYFESQEIRQYIITIVELHGGFPMGFLKYIENLQEEDVWKILVGNKYIVETLLYMIADNDTAIEFNSSKAYITNKLFPLILKKIHSYDF